MFVLIIIAILVFIFLLNHGGKIINIIFHFVIGWISLVIINIIPGINVPVNLITMAISGFGGIVGTIILVLFYLIF